MTSSVLSCVNDAIEPTKFWVQFTRRSSHDEAKIHSGNCPASKSSLEKTNMKMLSIEGLLVLLSSSLTASFVSAEPGFNQPMEYKSANGRLDVTLSVDLLESLNRVSLLGHVCVTFMFRNRMGVILLNISVKKL